MSLIRKDIANQKFGTLLAIKYVGPDSNGKSLWLCRCDCGAEKAILASSLLLCHTKSCGSGIHRRINLIGQRFGQFIVIAYHSTGGNGCLWVCKCDCGSIKIVAGANLKRGRTKSCGCAQRDMMRNKIGDNNPQYLFGDYCGLPNRQYKLKATIRKRDNWTCQKCRKTQKNQILEIGYVLPVHHINCNPKDDRESNLITYCISCHRKTHSEIESLLRLFK